MESLKITVSVLALGVASSFGAAENHGAGARTYCNPLSLPDYPRGAFAQKDAISDALGDPALLSRQGAFREAGDPAVIVEKGVWYLYVSGVMAGCWKSADHGATWERVDVGLPEFAFGKQTWGQAPGGCPRIFTN